MTAPDPRLNECATCLGCPDCGPVSTKRTVEAIAHRLGKVSEGPWMAWDRGIGYEIHNTYGEPINDRHRETFSKGDAEFIAMAPGDVYYLLAELRKAHEALDELMYAANHKAADNQIGRSWAEVIRGPIIRHLGAEAAGKMGAAVAAAKGDE